ncbi:MAG TPA: hypothetical protein DEA52_03650 [Clostridiaceae bacterium]|nr:hypothetical protein [Clostridiaceae bacterium]
MNRLDYIEELGTEIFQANMLIHSKLINFQTMAKVCDLPPSHIKMLFFLKKSGEKTMGDLAKLMEVSKPNVTPIVDRLMADGLVARKEGEKDRRKLLVFITKEGEAFIHELHEKAKVQMGLVLEVLSKEDLQKLYEAAVNLTEILRKL